MSDIQGEGNAAAGGFTYVDRLEPGKIHKPVRSGFTYKTPAQTTLEDEAEAGTLCRLRAGADAEKRLIRLPKAAAMKAEEDAIDSSPPRGGEAG